MPLTPVGFQISDKIVKNQFINLSLSWDAAEGLSSEMSYLIVASPLLSESQINVTTSDLSATIILSYNTEYNLSLQGINCAGVGPPATNFGILYGKM